MQASADVYFLHAIFNSFFSSSTLFFSYFFFVLIHYLFLRFYIISWFWFLPFPSLFPFKKQTLDTTDLLI